MINYSALKYFVGSILLVNVICALLYFLGGLERAKLSMDQRLLDFGIVPDGAAQARCVKLTNTGNSDLVISKIQLGCGCTAAKIYPDGPIAPGKSATVEVTLKLRGIEAETGKEVTVYVFSNDPDQPVALITAKARAVKERIADPDFIDFGRIIDRNLLPMTREVRLPTEYVLQVGSEQEFISVSPNKTSDSSRYFAISLLKNAPSGDFCLDLICQNSASSVRENVRVRGHIYGEYFCIPQMVTLGPALPDDRPIGRTVEIKRRNGKESESNREITIDKVIVTKELGRYVSVDTKKNGSGIDATISMNPHSFVGTWSDQSVLGRVEFHLCETDSHSAVLNLPVAVTTGMRKVRGP